ncbi:MAG: cytochrome c biogenesis heme-transporting ATPase CcmA [Chromatiales bacterium]|jgi:heme exporter protein A|nr:cytochrome c biogenesis heme-transporting ATPase CcmA [Chromatiales bacterium]
MLFEHLTLSVGQGEALQIAGRNGSGKTTLLRILCGLVLPTEGAVSWNGEPIHSRACTLRGQLCYLGYAGGVKLDLTPRENLHYLRALHSFNPSVELDQALSRVDLYGFEDVPAYTLSAGQRRRISLARLLVSAAKLWVLDEPLTALDQRGTALVQTLLNEHLANGGVLLFTTHQALDNPPPGTKTLELG